MTQDNLLSTLRAILIIVGSYVVGHNIFGHAVDMSTWQVVSGAIVTVSMTIWGIAAKTTNVEGLESALRSVLTSIGGLFVSAGMLSGDNLTAMLGLVGSLSPLLQSILSKSKNSQIASGTIKPTITGKAIKMILILLLTGISLKGSSQSMAKALPKIISPFDSVSSNTYVGFRFTGPTIMYGTSFTNLKESDLYTFIGIDFEKATKDPVSNKYYTDWAIGLHGGEGGQFAPTSVSAVTAAALSLSTQRLFNSDLPFKLTVGFIYNLTMKQGQPAIGPGIPLNN